MDKFRLIENYITNYYKEFCDKRFTYHNLDHVKFVVDTVVEFGNGLNLNNEDVEILKIAAWFHDIGHFSSKEEHEKISANTAKSYLEIVDYPKDKIDSVTKCIIATDLAVQPTNILEMIIKDADLSHLGSNNYITYGDNLLEEFIKRKICSIDYNSWLKSSIEFFEKHQYYTAYAKNLYEKQKAINLAKLNSMLIKNPVVHESK